MQAVSRTFTQDIHRPSSILLPRRALVRTAVVVVSLMAILAAIADGLLLAVDEPIANAIRRYEGYEAAFRWIGKAGSSRSGFLLAVIAAVPLYRRCRTFGHLLPLAVIAGVIADVVLKLLIDRPRPDEPLTGTALGSFPSGHVIHAVVFLGLLPLAIYLLTGRRWLWLTASVVAVVGVLGVGASRIYLAAHWPSDVFAGIVVGAAVLLALDQYLVRFPCDGCRLHPASRRSPTSPSGVRRNSG
jgi:membrane-associated phospholipid phosphatase